MCSWMLIQHFFISIRSNTPASPMTKGTYIVKATIKVFVKKRINTSVLKSVQWCTENKGVVFGLHSCRCLTGLLSLWRTEKPKMKLSGDKGINISFKTYSDIHSFWWVQPTKANFLHGPITYKVSAKKTLMKSRNFHPAFNSHHRLAQLTFVQDLQFLKTSVLIWGLKMSPGKKGLISQVLLS